MAQKIPLTRGKFALVDDEDFEELSKVKWQCRPNGAGVDYASRAVKVNGTQTTITMHRVIMQAAPRRMIDHIDGDGLNNVRSNLRLATKAQNARNGKKRRSRNGVPASSRFKGVGLQKDSGRWIASICVKGQNIHLGCYKDEEEAARAYDKAALRHFGVFARPNFPEPT